MCPFLREAQGRMTDQRLRGNSHSRPVGGASVATVARRHHPGRHRHRNWRSRSRHYQLA